MYQPLPCTDEVGMRRANGEIIHLPCGLLEGDRIDLAIRPIRFADVAARLQFVRGQPAFLFSIEGVFGRGLDLFMIDHQVLDHRVGVHQHIRDRVVIGGLVLFVVGQYLVAHLDLADRALALVGLTALTQNAPLRRRFELKLINCGCIAMSYG